MPDPDRRAVDSQDALGLDHDDPQDLGSLDGLGEALRDREDVVDALCASGVRVVVPVARDAPERGAQHHARCKERRELGRCRDLVGGPTDHRPDGERTCGGSAGNGSRDRQEERGDGQRDAGESDGHETAGRGARHREDPEGRDGEQLGGDAGPRSRLSAIGGVRAWRYAAVGAHMDALGPFVGRGGTLVLRAHPGKRPTRIGA